jgi:glycosyltransferase involved in cell wall biosynthesis
MHANSGVAALVACVPGLLTGTPVIWHQRDIVPPRRINRLVLGLCGRLASAVVGTSGAVADSLAAIGVQRHKLRVIYPRIDDRFFEPLPPQREARKSLGIPEEGLMLTVLGRLVPHKGQHVFLEMLSHLRSRGQDVYGLLVGHLPSEPGADDALAAYVSALERAAGEPQLQGRVSFLGRRDDVPTVLAASDLLVVPSTAEPFGRVIIEAFAAGVPVIASQSGGPLEIIEERVTGMLVPVGDAGAFADAAYHLLSDPQAREAMVSHARDQAWARFSMAGLRDDVGRLYRSLSVPVPVRETVQREA